MPAEKLGQRMHDDVGAMLDGAGEVGRGQRVVDDEGHACLLGDGGDGIEVGDDAAGIGNRLDEDRLGLRCQCRAKRGSIRRVGEAHRPAAFGEGLGELIDRAAVKLARGDELVPRFEQCVEHEHLRRVTRRDGKRSRAALERRDALLEHRLGRVGDARIDVTEGLEIEQSRRMLDVVEDIGRGLIDRRRPRAGRGVRLRTGVDGKRVEAGLPVSGHVLDLPSGQCC